MTATREDGKGQRRVTAKQNQSVFADLRLAKCEYGIDTLIWESGKGAQGATEEQCHKARFESLRYAVDDARALGNLTSTMPPASLSIAQLMNTLVFNFFVDASHRHQCSYVRGSRELEALRTP